MRTLLVTSAVTFVPKNYDAMVLAMAEEPSIVGLIVLENRSWKMYWQAIALILSLSSPRLGLQILINLMSFSNFRREVAYTQKGKHIWHLPSINSEQAHQIIKDHKIDLIVNCRTREIYSAKTLQAPSLGCINIHHGILPQQKGLMCDFWAHLEGESFGFSIHQMTRKIDDGPVLEVVTTKSEGKNYLENIYLSSVLESQACKKVIRQIQSTGQFPVEKRFSQDVYKKSTYRKNPGLLDGYKAQWKGIKI
ncbi:MAG: formyltransferase family protein [Pseudobdellovibrionaceae bacterium]